MSEQAILQRLTLGPMTETTLATMLGISGEAVQAQIESLRAAGIEITRDREHNYVLAQPLELLDREKIRAALSNDAQAQLHALTLSFATDSTQTQALIVAVPEHGCALWLAEQQTAGQGRLGRVWTSPLAAHLYFSVSRRFTGGFKAVSGLSLMVAVVLAETLRQHGFARVAVKWPNDLCVDGKKLGGILVQLRGASAGPCEAVIGVGINVRMPTAAAASIEQPWCDLSQLATDNQVISRNDLAAALINHLLPAFAQFDRDGFAAFGSRWQALDALPGQTVRVLDANRVHEGRALGITEVGALRIQQSDGEYHYHGGEVSVRAL